MSRNGYADTRPRFHTSITCPECGDTMNKLVDSRRYRWYIRRRRECRLGHRFTTRERVGWHPCPPVFNPDFQI